jgi:molybdopterin molybdotransferase
MTGGVMPAGCDSVVPQEFVTEEDGVVIMAPGTIRPATTAALPAKT